MPTLEEYKVRYFNAFFAMRRIMAQAEEAMVNGLPDAHDSLVTAANVYRKRFMEVKQEAMKQFPQEYVREFVIDTTGSVVSEKEIKA